MKTLLIMRHGEASDAASSDFERRLTKHGRASAKATGNELQQRKLLVDGVITSSAFRAVETTHAVLGALHFPLERVAYERILYEQSVDTMLDLLSVTDSLANTLYIVGHNPSVSELATKLSGTPLSFSPGKLVALTFAIEDWREVTRAKGVVAFVIEPSIHQAPLEGETLRAANNFGKEIRTKLESLPLEDQLFSNPAARKAMGRFYQKLGRMAARRYAKLARKHQQ